MSQPRLVEAEDTYLLAQVQALIDNGTLQRLTSANQLVDALRERRIRVSVERVALGKYNCFGNETVLFNAPGLMQCGKCGCYEIPGHTCPHGRRHLCRDCARHFLQTGGCLQGCPCFDGCMCTSPEKLKYAYMSQFAWMHCNN